VQLALRTCIGADPARPRIVRIADSLHTETLAISEALEEEARTRGLEILTGPEPWPFDRDGNLW
jgi:hypothetical protein